MLNWRTITPTTSAAFLVKGTELSFAIVPHTRCRFGISEVRTVLRTANGQDYDRQYCVRDAAAVSDVEVKDGKRPPVVATFDSDLDAIKFCLEMAEHDP